MIEPFLEEVTAFINHLSHRDMAWIQRFAKSGHPLFDDNRPFSTYFTDRFTTFYGGMTPAVSKEIGHDESTESKMDILLESRDEGFIGLWLVFSPMDLEWYIQRWVAGYTTSVSPTGWMSLTEGIGAWITGDYKLEKVDGVYNDG